MAALLSGAFFLSGDSQMGEAKPQASGTVSQAGRTGKAQATEGPSGKAHLVKNYGRLPLGFIENRGQVHKKVKFYEKGSGHATWFT